MERVAAIVRRDAGAANAGLQEFAFAYYAQAGIATALVSLQDRECLDVCLALYALWHGVSGRGRIDDRQLAVADRAVRVIRRELIEPLRAVRRRAGRDPDAAIARLRASLAATEIEIEKIALQRLSALAGLPDDACGRDARIAAAHANLALCLGPGAVSSAEAAILRDGLVRFVAGADDRARPP
jgi:uncharacterized protein (TIGR02444 family)